MIIRQCKCGTFPIDHVVNNNYEHKYWRFGQSNRRHLKLTCNVCGDIVKEEDVTEEDLMEELL